LNLPDVLVDQVLRAIDLDMNKKVEHDEWLKFMLLLTCGSFKNRLQLIFKLFDFEDSQCIRQEYVK
jgi:Ca2+-binding EF-hand superfamily protein